MHLHSGQQKMTSTPCCWRRPGCALPVTRPRSTTWLRLGTRSFPPPVLQGVLRKRRGHRLRHKGLSEAACRYHFVLSRSAPQLLNRSADSNVQQATNQLIMHLPPSTQQKEQNSETTQCMNRPRKNMDDRKSAQTERRHNKSSSLSLFIFLETFHRFLPWFDNSWLSQYPLLWFCQEPWIHSWLKTVHEEARHKNLSNCLFRA